MNSNHRPILDPAIARVLLYATILLYVIGILNHPTVVVPPATNPDHNTCEYPVDEIAALNARIQALEEGGGGE